MVTVTASWRSSKRNPANTLLVWTLGSRDTKWIVSSWLVSVQASCLLVSWYHCTLSVWFGMSNWHTLPYQVSLYEPITLTVSPFSGNRGTVTSLLTSALLRSMARYQDIWQPFSWTWKVAGHWLSCMYEEAMVSASMCVGKHDHDGIQGHKTSHQGR